MIDEMLLNGYILFVQADALKIKKQILRITEVWTWPSAGLATGIFQDAGVGLCDTTQHNGRWMTHPQ